MLSAFQVKVRSSSQTLRRIVKGMTQKRNQLNGRKKNIRHAKRLQRLMPSICLLLNFVFEKKKKILLRGMCFCQEVQKK